MSEPKLDTPLKLKDIEDIAKAFKAANIKLPPGEHWQDNLSVDFYHGMLASFNLCIKGLINHSRQEGADMNDLINEFNIIAGQLSVKIVEKTPKIITL